MSFLTAPWLEQPRDPIEIEWDEPLSQGLVAAFTMGGHTYDSVTGKRAALGAGASFVRTEQGLVLKGDGAAAVASFPIDLSAYNKITVSFNLYWPTYANDDKLAFEFTPNVNTNNGGFFLNPNQGSRGAFTANLNGVTGADTRADDITRPSAGSHFISIVYDLSTATDDDNIKFYVDGVFVADSDVTGATVNQQGAFANSTLYLLSRAGTSLFGNGGLSAFTIHNRGLSDADLLELARNKWRVYKHQQRRLWVPYRLSSRVGHSVVIGHQTSPYLSSYLLGAGGFSEKFGPPSTLPAGNVEGVAFSPSGKVVAFAHFTSPYVSVYEWGPDGLGARFSNPATLPAGDGKAVSFSPTGDAIIIAHDVSPYVSAYPWDDVTGFGTKFADPASTPASVGASLAFSPAGDAIVVGHFTTPYVSAYPWNSGTGFGTKFSDPATLPAHNGRGVAFSPAGDAIVVGHQNPPFLTAYPWNISTGFGTKFSDPATLPGSLVKGMTFNAAGNVLVVAHDGSPYTSAYNWDISTGFGSKFADPATLPTGLGYDVAFTTDESQIAVVHQNSPYVSAYAWTDAGGFGAKFSDPNALPSGNGRGISFGRYVGSQHRITNLMQAVNRAGTY